MVWNGAVGRERDDRCKVVPGELPGLAEDWLWDEGVREREVSRITSSFPA